jgi:predicted RNase H-like nuclease (RuvC/YqgF family)
MRNLSREKGIISEALNIKWFGGYVRSEFTVYAKRGEIPIQSMASNDAQVIVKSVERDQIRYVPLKQKKLRRRFTIVGIDQGMTVGIAVLSLDGDLLYLKSFRGIAPDKVVKLIAEYWKPALVASDVTPMPVSVEKIRRSFNVVPASPGIEVSAEEKIALGKTFGYSNDHERDALTAALLTYRSYKNIFTRIEKKAPVDSDLELLKLYVIRGDSIEDAIEKIRAPGALVNTRVKKIPGNPGEGVVDVSLLKMREIIQRQREQIQNLQIHLEELKKELVIKDKKTSKLESKLNGFKREAYSEVRKLKEIKTRDEIIESLKKELSHKNKTVKELRNRSNKLRKIRKMEISGVGTPVKLITAFTKESIAETKEKYGLKEGDVVFLENSSGGGASTAKILIESKVKAVLIQEDISHAAEETFFKGGVPVLRGIPLKKGRRFCDDRA